MWRERKEKQRKKEANGLALAKISRRVLVKEGE